MQEITDESIENSNTTVVCDGSSPFITEVVGRFPSSIPSTDTIRPPESITTNDAVSDVFSIIDKLGEKQIQTRKIRSLVQKAAQKTFFFVRAKNATQSAENVTIRFHPDHMTETPRCIQIQDIATKVLNHASFISIKKQQEFYNIFTTAPELTTILKDMFWYLTAHCFQSGQHQDMEKLFYQRIADNFTALFIRIQVQPSSRETGFFEKLPDIVAQILLLSLYESFPKSRKLMTSELRQQILRICYGWIVGFVPADLTWSHWIPMDQESPKRMAALAEFPAMRNRMIRVARIERTKLEMKHRQGTVFDDNEEINWSNDRSTDESTILPRLGTSSTSSAVPGTVISPSNTTKLVETRERSVYEMQNSPLVTNFLSRHHLDANAAHLKLHLRLTNANHLDLQQQQALHSTTLPKERRRRLVNTNTYVTALDQIEQFGQSVRISYLSEKKKEKERDVMEQRVLKQEQQTLKNQFHTLRQNTTKLHEYSNSLVSKRGMDVVIPIKDTSTSTISHHYHVSTVSMTPITPRPPTIARTMKGSSRNQMER